jgi:hypothetical protein
VQSSSVCHRRVHYLSVCDYAISSQKWWLQAAGHDRMECVHELFLMVGWNSS